MKKWIRVNSDPLITYQLELKTKKSSDELVFEDLWINEKRYKYHLSRHDRKFACSFGKKEILKLSIISEIKDGLTSGPPKPTKGILLLVYTFRSKKKFISVKKIRDIDTMRIAG
jgi:hypothetical protein